MTVISWPLYCFDEVTMIPGSTANGIVTDVPAPTASDRPSPTKLPPE